MIDILNKVVLYLAILAQRSLTGSLFISWFWSPTKRTNTQTNRQTDMATCRVNLPRGPFNDIFPMESDLGGTLIAKGGVQ